MIPKKVGLLFPIIIMLVFIFDAKTAIMGAKEGINICIYTVIPSLFPLMILSIYMTRKLSNTSLKLLDPLAKLCRIGKDSKSLLLVGLIGGYPVGAQCIANEYNAGNLSRKDANRMLAFCSNAGPSFIFGIAGTMFQSPFIPWLLWIIHMLSSIITAAMIPGSCGKSIPSNKSDSISFSDAMKISIRSLSYICGWVVLFQTFSKLLYKTIIGEMRIELTTVMIGFTELVSGFQYLRIINDEKLKFILCSVFLAFGGLCVCMQTRSVIEDLDISYYLSGKLIQTGISFILASTVSTLIFPGNSLWIWIANVIIITALYIFLKIRVDFHKIIVYNTKKPLRG